MTMAIDNQQRQHFGPVGYDSMHYPPTTAAFNNPWTSAPTATSSSAHMYPTSGMAAPSSMGYDLKSQVGKPSSIHLPYSSMPTTTPTSYPTTAYSQADMMHTQPAAYDYSSAAQQPVTYASAGSSYAPMHSYAQTLSAQQHDQGRRISNSSATDSMPASTSSFGDAIEASRGMVAMSQTDITPRNIYGPRADRNSIDSYGFPSAHSSHSSISSASGFSHPHYNYAGSVADSATDYSSASESVDGMSHSRTLPRPVALPGLPATGGMHGLTMAAAHLPPAPQSMMGSFNSKISTNQQKKHKCKICDKRFTRPSSLQTHMYSHTGEKPFPCNFPGCGRNFSVVSNLRRHKKVHKNGAAGSAAGSVTGSDARSMTDDGDHDDENDERESGDESASSNWGNEHQ